MTTLPAPTTTIKSKRPERTMRVERDPFGPTGLVRITVGKKSDLYHTSMIPCDPCFGPFAWSCTRLNEDHTPAAESYHLTCSSPNPESAVILCDCKGFTRWGSEEKQDACKHAAALRVLLARLED